jgi:thiamine biosynthesis lipoprotein
MTLSRRVFVAGLAGSASLVAFPAIAGTGAWARHSYRQVHMGMIARVTLYARHEAQAKEAARVAFAALADVDRALSHFNRGSEVMSLTRTLGTRLVSPVLRDNLLLADEMHRISAGRFDASVGPLTHLWREARRTGVLPDEDALAAASKSVQWRGALSVEGDRVSVDREGLILDFGGSGKGYAVDRAAAALAEQGITAAMIELGGDIRLMGPPPGSNGWTTAVQVEGKRRVMELADCAVSTSGPAFQSRTWEGSRHSHVIDAASGKALTNHRRLSVTGPNGRECDAAATIIAMMEPGESSDFIQRNFRGVHVYAA